MRPRSQQSEPTNAHNERRSAWVVASGKIMLRGHRRIVERLGEFVGKRTPPSGGYRVSCLCGWGLGASLFRYADCIVSYRDHLREVESRPRVCRGCSKTKSPDKFNTKWSRYLCIECYYKMGNNWSRENPERASVHKRNHHLEKTFKMTQIDFERMLESQGGVCAICSLELRDKRGFSPHIDHDHATGLVRGVLCLQCNSGLGLFGDNVEVMKLAIKYLEKHS